MAISMYILTMATSITMAIVIMTIAMFCERWVAASFWMMPSTISQRDDIGIVAGAMNTLGNVGGALVPIGVGLIVSFTGAYYWALILFLAFAVGISIFPLLVDLTKKVGGDIAQGQSNN